MVNWFLQFNNYVLYDLFSIKTSQSLFFSIDRLRVLLG